MTRRAVQAAAIACGLLALLAAAAGCVPYAQLQPLGAWVRRPEDVTPERYARYLHLCWWFAATLLVLAGWLWLRATNVSDFLRAVWNGTAAPRPSSPAAESGADEPIARTEAWLLALIFLVGAGLRLVELPGPMAYDEAYTYVNFASRPWYEAIGDYNSTNNHLLNTLLVHVCGRLFGPREWALRLPVFVLGCALPVVVWNWARAWRGHGVAALTAALTAIAPALISYAADARGYMYVAVAAVVLDASLARVSRRWSARAWVCAWGAMTLGLCAMPIMAYAVVASVGWFVLLPRRSAVAGADRRDTFLTRLHSVAPLGLLSAWCVSVFYSPAYLFRGLLFLRDPILQAAPADSYATRLWESWREAAQWWTDGPFPGWLWGGLAVAGGLSWRGARRDAVRWCAPFLVVLALNVAQRVAPPPRILLHLSPWVFLLCAGGAESLARWCLRAAQGLAQFLPQFAIPGLTCLLLIAGVWEDRRREVLFFPEERLSYVSVPDVIARLQQEVSARPRERHILFAPLPCDLPSIFYMDRRGFRVPVNVRPTGGERVWLMARRGESIETVLASGLIRCDDLADRFTTWEPVAEFQTLRLLTAEFAPSPADTSTAP